MAVLIRQLPRDAALHRSLRDGEDEWSLTDHLLALQYDALAALIWQNGGGKGARPKPLPRPGAKPTVKKLGGTPRPIAELRTILDDWHAGRLDTKTKKTTKVR